MTQSVSVAYSTENAKASRTPVYRATFTRDYDASILLDAPSLYLKQDEASGATAEDSSGNNLDGTYQNSPQRHIAGPVLGVTNRAVRYNGVNQYTTVPDNALLDPGNTFTIEGWVFLLSLATQQTIVDKGTNGYQVYVATDGTLTLFKTGGAEIIFSLPGAITTGRWYHFAATKDGSTLGLYIDGISNALGELDQTVSATASDLNIGRTVAGANYLSGSVSRLKVYPAALSAARIKAHSQARGRRYSTHRISDFTSLALSYAPSLYLRLNELSGTAAEDSSGNNLDGTYQNAPTLGVTGPLSGSSQKAVTLNGTDEYISVADNALLDPGDTFTLAVFIKPASIGLSNRLIASKGANGYGLYLDGATVRLAQPGVDIIVDSTIPVTTSAWWLVVATKSGATVKLYINGVDATGTVWNQTIVATAQALHIGAHSPASDFFSGSLGEFLLYPTALTAAQIQNLYAAASLGSYSPDWLPYMQLPQGIAANIEPSQGRASVGAMTSVFVDVDGEITDLIGGEGLGGDTVKYEAGFWDIPGEEFATWLTGKPTSCKLTPELQGYEISVQDPQALLNRKFCVPSKSTLVVALTSGATSAVIEDTTDYEVPGYLRIEDEILQFSGKTAGIQIAEKTWQAIAYGAGKWVAVAVDGSVATSPDAINWTLRAAAEANQWYGIAWSPTLSLFAAVSGNGTNRVMTSPDGITWTARAAAAANQWRAIAWGSGVFVAVAVDRPTTARVMTSPDGITWTGRLNGSAGDDTDTTWQAIAYAPSLDMFCAVGDAIGGGTAKLLMTSTDDGVNWTGRSVPIGCLGIAWSPSIPMFAAVSLGSSDPTIGVITSPDGVTWTKRNPSAISISWRAIAWSATLSLFVAVASGGATRVMTSEDGITWTSRTAAALNSWQAVAYDNGLFVAVSNTGAGTRAMSSADGITWAYYNSTLTGLTRGVTVTGITTVAAAHAAGIAVSEVFRLGPAHLMDILEGVYTDTTKAGCAIPAAMVDSVQIAAVKASLGSAYLAEFLVEEAVNAKVWTEANIFKPAILYPRTTGDGKLSVVEVATPGSADDTLDADSLVVDEAGVPKLLTYDIHLASVINSITYEYGYNFLTRQFAATKLYTNAASIARYGEKPLPNIQALGLHSHLTGTVEFIAARAAAQIARYKDGAPLIQWRTFLRKHLLEPGDIVNVTLDALPNRATGTMGLVSEPMEVINRAIQTDQGHVDLTLLDTGWWL